MSVKDWLAHAVVHTDVPWLAHGSTCGSQAEVLTTLMGFCALPYTSSDLPLMSLERAGGGGCIS